MWSNDQLNFRDSVTLDSNSFIDKRFVYILCVRVASNSITSHCMCGLQQALTLRTSLPFGVVSVSQRMQFKTATDT